MTSELFADDESVELSNNNNNNNKIILDWSNTKRIESLGIRAIQTTSRSRHSTTNVYKNKKKKQKKKQKLLYVSFVVVVVYSGVVDVVVGCCWISGAR